MKINIFVALLKKEVHTSFMHIAHMFMRTTYIIIDTLKEQIMVKSNSRTDDRTSDALSVESSFPVAFSLEKFHDEVLTLYVHQIKKSEWFMRKVPMQSSDDKAARIWDLYINRIPEEAGALYSGTAVDQIGITYEDISMTPFAERLDVLYQYAYFGVVDLNKTTIERGGDDSWIAALVCDFKNSFYMQEWDGLVEDDEEGSAYTCFRVVELANARWQLENGVNFTDISHSSSDESTGAINELTIHQMSLLAGMEEMSIRAAANPKRANPLVTFSDEGKTRITLTDAKAWLISKNRYVAIQVKDIEGDVDLTKRKFLSQEDLLHVVLKRLFYLSKESKKVENLSSYLADLIETYQIASNWIDNPDLVLALAEHLKFPHELFALRIREMQANEELKTVARELSTSYGVQN